MFRVVNHIFENIIGTLDWYIPLHYLSEELKFLLKIVSVPSCEILKRCETPHFYISSSITMSFVCNHLWMWQTTLFRIHQDEERVPIHQSELMKKGYYYFYSNSMEMMHDDFWLEYMFHIWTLPHWPVKTYSKINASDIKRRGVCRRRSLVRAQVYCDRDTV